MNEKRRYILWFAFAISVMVHLFVLLPGLVIAATPTEKDLTKEETVNKSEFQPPEEKTKDEIKLGIDKSEASTLTWIGYDEYQKHMARLAKVEQAELQAASAQPVSGGAPAAPQSPQSTPQPPTQPTPEPAAAPTATDPTRTPPPPGGLPPLQQGPAPPGDTAIPTPGAPSTTPEATKPVPTPKDSKAPEATKPEEKPSQPPQKTQPDKPKKDEQPKKPTPPQPPATPSKAGPGGASGEGPPGPKAEPAKDETNEDLPPKPNASKTDSSATSTIKVPRKDWLSGKPLAAHGLRLFPRRPRFTPLQTVTNRGSKNLIVRLEFNAKGRPAKALIVRGSGDSRIDKVILSSLYKWRAQGEKLKDLKKDELIPIQLEIVMSVK